MDFPISFHFFADTSPIRHQYVTDTSPIGQRYYFSIRDDKLYLSVHCEICNISTWFSLNICKLIFRQIKHIILYFTFSTIFIYRKFHIMLSLRFFFRFHTIIMPMTCLCPYFLSILFRIYSVIYKITVHVAHFTDCACGSLHRLYNINLHFDIIGEPVCSQILYSFSIIEWLKSSP